MIQKIISNAGECMVEDGNGGFKLLSEADTINPKGPPLFIIFDYNQLKRSVNPENSSLFDAAYDTLYGELSPALT